MNQTKYSNAIPLVLTALAFALCLPYNVISETSGNHSAWLALIFKTMDPTWLERDFFVAQALDFGPRYYFVNFISTISSVFGVWTSLFLIHIASHMLLFIVTYLICRKLFANGLISFILVIGLVYCVKMPAIGGSTRLFGFYTFPHHSAIPLILCALYFALRLSPYKTAAFAFLSSLVHPQVGAEIGFIILFSLLITEIVNYKRHSTNNLKHTFGGMSLFLVLIAAFWIFPALGILGNMSSAEFIKINIFRQYHHVYPLAWPTSAFNELAIFLFVMTACWIFLAKICKNRTQILIIAMVTFCILSALVIGYLSSKYFPSKYIMSLQPFRMVLMIKYLGFLSVGGFGSALLAFALKNVGIRNQRVGVALLATIALELIIGISKIPDRLASDSFKLRVQDPRPHIENNLSKLVKQLTSPNSLILTPPESSASDLRVLSERSLVVDFKSYPFQELTMREWYKRMLRIYGFDGHKGFSYVAAALKRYKHMTDDRLIAIRSEYGNEHAILFNDTPTEFLVLGSDRKYKLVQLPQ